MNPSRPSIVSAILRQAALACLLFGGTCLGAIDMLVQPYVQPGPDPTLEGSDGAFLIWMTVPGDETFTVEYGLDGDPARRTAPIQRVEWDFHPDTKPGNGSLDARMQAVKYTAALTGLPFDHAIRYRVAAGGSLIREGVFTTRSSADRPLRLVAVGDLASGGKGQNLIAYQISLVKPRAMLLLGDIVYPSGRLNQYARYFWPTFNQPASTSPDSGAPLMASVMFYAVNGNHDIYGQLPTAADGLGIFQVFRVPRSGPGAGPWDLSPGDSPEAKRFLEQASPTFPDLCHYSFDDGPAHILVLDNILTRLTDPKLLAWIQADLSGSKARWKIVCFHAPPFESHKAHYEQQGSRWLAPLFESCGVDLVLAGHVHDYQRSRPLRFAPQAQGTKQMVDGVFTLDQDYDGVANTHPNGIIYLVAGGGGASLNGGALESDLATRFPRNWAPYTVKYVGDQHSFVVMDLTTGRLEARVIGDHGAELDRFVITKP